MAEVTHRAKVSDLISKVITPPIDVSSKDIVEAINCLEISIVSTSIDKEQTKKPLIRITEEIGKYNHEQQKYLCATSDNRFPTISEVDCKSNCRIYTKSGEKYIEIDFSEGTRKQLLKNLYPGLKIEL